MTRVFFAAAILALAAPAVAQSATPPEDKGQMAAEQSMAPDEPAKPEVPADPKAVIAAEFPSYDRDGNGALNVAEFDSWMLALKAKSAATPMAPAEQASWLKAAFAKADSNKNNAVSQAELITYLTAGA